MNMTGMMYDDLGIGNKNKKGCLKTYISTDIDFSACWAWMLYFAFFVIFELFFTTSTSVNDRITILVHKLTQVLLISFFISFRIMHWLCHDQANIIIFTAILIKIWIKFPWMEIEFSQLRLIPGIDMVTYKF